MNPHILVVVQVRFPSDQIAWGDFQKFLVNETIWPESDTAKHLDPKIQLATNVWLIPLNTGLPFAGKLVAATKKAHLSCKFLYFEDELEWLYPGDKPPSLPGA